MELVTPLTDLVRIEVGIIEPQDMDYDVALGWFGVDAEEWKTVQAVQKTGTRVLFYVWEMFTGNSERLGSMVYTRPLNDSAKWLRALDSRRQVLHKDTALDDFETIGFVAEWAEKLAQARSTAIASRVRIAVSDCGRCKEEKDLAWDFAALLTRRRAGKKGRVITTFPIPKDPVEGRNDGTRHN